MKHRVLTFCAVLGCAGGASAQTVFADNFDSYGAGSLLNSHAPWAPISSENYTISTTHARSGPNSAKVVGQGVTGSTDFAWVDLNGGSNIGYDSSRPILTGSVSMWMNSGLSATDWAGFTVFDQSVNRIAGIRYNGAGALQFWSDLGWNGTSVTAPMDEWVNLRITATYTSATTGIVQYYVNSLRFDAYTLNFGSGFGVADFDLYQFGNATAYFDDYSVVRAVPEPASVAALGLGVLALYRRKRKSA